MKQLRNWTASTRAMMMAYIGQTDKIANKFCVHKHQPFTMVVFDPQQFRKGQGPNLVVQVLSVAYVLLCGYMCDQKSYWRFLFWLPPTDIGNDKD